MILIVIGLATACGSSAPAATTSTLPTVQTITCTVFATREGLVGHTTANGHVIQPSDRFVALPSKSVLASAGGNEFEVRITYKNRTVTVPVWDVGPWNTEDNYWDPSDQRLRWKDLPQCRPEAQAAYEAKYNDGKDQSGRQVKNPAGIDLSDGTWAALGMTDNDRVVVEYLWTKGSAARGTGASAPTQQPAAPAPSADKPAAQTAKAPVTPTVQPLVPVGGGVRRFDNTVDLYDAIAAGKVSQGNVIEVYGKAISYMPPEGPSYMPSDRASVITNPYAALIAEKSSTEVSQVWCLNLTVDDLNKVNIRAGYNGDHIGFKGTLGSTKLTSGGQFSMTILRDCVVLLQKIGPVTQSFDGTADLREAILAGKIALGTVVKLSGFIDPVYINPIQGDRVAIANSADRKEADGKGLVSCKQGPGPLLTTRGLKTGDPITVTGKIEFTIGLYGESIALNSCTIVSR